MVNSKRPLGDSDSEEEQKEVLVASSRQVNGGSAAKRARLATNGNDNDDDNGTTRLHPESSDDEDVDELATPAPQAGPSRKTAAKTGRDIGDVTMQWDGSDDESSEEEDEGDDNDRAAVRTKALSGKAAEKGKIAQAGVVDTVVMKNFMCHKYMEVKLNPQINFIIGHNGSGKSVILTAITYAFGAKASASNRGSSQNSFIRSGQTSCEVTLGLRNKGDEAYKYDVYGKTIYITRRTSIDGSGSYKIANSERKSIATTRSELSAICDHFQIQVDNPVNILHQDMAKLFLHSSKPTDKYRFFLKGTQLEQLLDEYQVLLHQTQALQTITRSKKDRLEELKENMRTAHAAWKEIEQTRNVETNIRKLKNELAWTHVVEIEKDTEAAVSKQDEEKQKLAKIGTKVQVAKKEHEDAKDKLAAAQAAEEEDDGTEKLKKELDEVTVQIKALTAQIADARSEQREMQENISNLRAQSAERDKELLEEQSRADGPLKQRMMESRAKLERLDQQREELTAIVQTNRDKVVEVAKLFEEREKYDEAKREHDIARQAFEHADTAIRNLQASQENFLNRFGNFAANIVAAIDREKGWRQKPIGPIGNFIKLKDPRWARVCESVCGDRLNAFLVSNDEDRARLNNLIKNFRGARHNVIRWQWDATFEDGLQRSLPDRQHSTMLDVLSFENEYVRQAFIATASPEGSILVKDRPLGDQIMRNNDPEKTHIKTCYTLDLYQLGGVRGGSRMLALQGYRGPSRLSKDVEADKQRAMVARTEADERLRRANDERARLDRLLASYTQQKKQAETDANTASGRLRRLGLERTKLSDEAQDFQPADVQAIEQMKQDALEEIESIKAQRRTSTAHVQELEKTCKPFVERKEEIRNLILQTEEIRRSRQDVMDELVTICVNKEHEAKAWAEKQAQHAKKAQELDDDVTAWGERLQTAIDQANEMCPRETVELKGRSIKKLESTIASLEKALRQQEERLGGSGEEIYKRYVKAKAVYEDNQKTIKDLKACALTMLNAYEIRMGRWATFRTHIATRARILFIRYLSQRNFMGDLRFRHNDHRLELRVQPNDDPETKNSQRMKDSATLSGGEKSFSTICLLLALWSAAGCPIRGLDEYDVYMDGVNRKIATNMLIEAGHAANNTQMILISPQAMQGYVDTPGVKVIRIADPERGQGTLATDTTG